MKRSVRLFLLVVTSLCLALMLPLPLFAQSDIPTLAIGDTFDLRANRAGFMLNAAEGQTVTLRWDGHFAQSDQCRALYPEIIHVETEITNAAGETLPQIGLLHQATDTSQAYTHEVYRLEGTGPYQVSAVQCNGQSVSVTVLDGDQISRLEQPALSIGGTASIAADVVPFDQLVVFPLNAQTGDTFTVESFFDDSYRNTRFPRQLAIVRDANGHLVLPDFAGLLPPELSLRAPVYTVDQPTPYSLEFIDVSGQVDGYIDVYGDDEIENTLSVTINLRQGNTAIEDRGMLTFGTPVQGTMTIGIPVFYTFDYPEDERLTYRFTYSQGTPYDYFFNADREPADVTDSFATEANSFNRNMRMMGPPPYVYYMDGEGSYTLLLEQGSTIPQTQHGTLAPGQSLAVTIPASDDVIDFVALDVNPESTVTLQWGITQTEFTVEDSGNMMMYSTNDDWNDGFATIDLTQGTAPFILRLDDARYVGQTITFTLAEGDTPLGADAAAPAPAADTSTSGETSTDSGTTSAGAVSCTVSAGGSINQRSGPGTNFAVSGTLAPGTSADVDGQTIGADGFTWYRLTSGVWVRGDLVTTSGDCSSVPQVTS